MMRNVGLIYMLCPTRNSDILTASSWYLTCLGKQICVVFDVVWSGWCLCLAVWSSAGYGPVLIL